MTSLLVKGIGYNVRLVPALWARFGEHVSQSESIRVYFT